MLLLLLLLLKEIQRNNFTAGIIHLNHMGSRAMMAIVGSTDSLNDHFGGQSTHRAVRRLIGLMVERSAKEETHASHGILLEKLLDDISHGGIRW